MSKLDTACAEIFGTPGEVELEIKSMQKEKLLSELPLFGPLSRQELSSFALDHGIELRRVLSYVNRRFGWTY